MTDINVQVGGTAVTEDTLVEAVHTGLIERQHNRTTKPKHAIRIESPHGKVFLTKVYLDGQQLRGVMAAHVDFDYPRDQNVLVTLTLAPGSLVLDGEARVVVKSELQDEIGKKDVPE